MSDTDYLYPSITSAGLKSKTDDACQFDILVCGHSHIPFVKVFQEKRVVNCGSVGLSIDGDLRGSYALVEVKKGSPVRSRIVRFRYPVQSLLDDIADRKVVGVKKESYQHAAALS